MTAAQHLRFWLIALALFAGAVWLLSGVLAPFLVGLALAYLLDPLVDRFERLKLPRWLGTLLALLLAVAAMIGTVAWLWPIIQDQVAGLVEAFPRYRDQFEALVNPLLGQIQDQIGPQEFERITGQLASVAERAINWLGSLLGGVWRGGMAVIDILSFLVITPVVAFYLLKDWDRMIAAVDRLLPRPYAATIRSLAGQADSTLGRFIRGQLLVCVVLGSVYAVSLGLAGLEFGILVGIGAGLISFIPFIGTLAGFVVSMVLALLQFDNWVMWLVIAGIFVAGQVLEGNFLTPKLLGDSVGLHPVWVMFALLAGGSLLGFTGVLIAVPAAAVMGVLIRFAIERYRDSHYFHGGLLDRWGDLDAASDEVDPARGRTEPAAPAGGEREDPSTASEPVN